MPPRLSALSSLAFVATLAASTGQTEVIGGMRGALHERALGETEAGEAAVGGTSDPETLLAGEDPDSTQENTSPSEYRDAMADLLDSNQNRPPSEPSALVALIK